MAGWNTQIPSLSDLNRFSVNRSGQAEAVRQTLYDYQTYDAAGVSQMTFFQQPVGQAGRTLADTNMLAAGSLPTPINFLITAIEIHFIPNDVSISDDTAVGEYIPDVQEFWQTPAWLALQIGSKQYLQEGGLYRLPPTTHLNVSGAAAIDAAAAPTNLQIGYADAAGKPYYLVPPLLLVTNQNFSVTLNWPAVAALPSTVDARVGIILDGILYRESQ